MTTPQWTTLRDTGACRERVRSQMSGGTVSGSTASSGHVVWPRVLIILSGGKGVSVSQK